MTGIAAAQQSAATSDFASGRRLGKNLGSAAVRGDSGAPRRRNATEAGSDCSLSGLAGRASKVELDSDDVRLSGAGLLDVRRSVEEEEDERAAVASVSPSPTKKSLKTGVRIAS